MSKDRTRLKISKICPHLQRLIDFFAQLLRANPKDYWGYVTTGGSEGNLYGLYVARERYPNSMVYYSETTHYSVKKNIHLLHIPSIVIRSQENGEIDYEDLLNTLLNNRHIPPIIMTNFGTTMKEGKDDVYKIKSILKKLAIKSYHIHSDGALSAAKWISKKRAGLYSMRDLLNFK